MALRLLARFLWDFDPSLDRRTARLREEDFELFEEADLRLLCLKGYETKPDLLLATRSRLQDGEAPRASLVEALVKRFSPESVSAEQKFSRLCYATPTPGADRAYKRRCMDKVEGSLFRRAVEALGTTGVKRLEEYPFGDPDSLEDVDNILNLELQDGATYVLCFEESTLEQRVRSAEHLLKDSMH
ncbi:hypothetical protein MMC07_005707 [Pseudocyphellaria aurata]|nr:hypothetical protein [Pseudocyphellaria aurata]